MFKSIFIREYLVIVIILLTLFLPMYFVFTQESYDDNPRLLSGIGTSALRNNASIVFDKSYSTYHWNGRVNYENQFGSYELRLREEFLSTIIRTDQKFIKDEQTFNLSLKKNIASGLKGSTRVNSFLLSDNKNLKSAQTFSHAFYGGINYTPALDITLEPLIGMRYDRQNNQQDKGPSFILTLNSDSLDFSGYKTQVNGSFQYDRLKPRYLETYNVNSKIEKRFINRTRNVAGIKYFRNRRDFYFPADSLTRKEFNIINNIDSRIENVFAVIDSLDYEVSKKLLVSFQGNISTRTINRETKYKMFADNRFPFLNTSISELKIESGVIAKYSAGEDFYAQLGFLYQERDEKHKLVTDPSIDHLVFESQSHIEETKSNSSRRTSMAVMIGSRITRSHSFEFSGSSNLLRYDTPSIDNDDERDELWYIFNLKTFHRISKHLYADITSEANLTHLVYLFSSRSADNTWNRVIRLSPRLEYIPFEELATVNTFEVVANYTVYDFELESSPIRSFVFRQFGFVDSTTFKLTKRIHFVWFNNIRLYERGEMRWSSFSEKPVNYFEDATCIGSIKYIKNDGLLFSVGIRYFNQARYDYDRNSLRLQSRLKSIGPIMNIMWYISKHSRFSMFGWYENLTQSNSAKRSFPNFTMSIQYFI